MCMCVFCVCVFMCQVCVCRVSSLCLLLKFSYVCCSLWFYHRQEQRTNVFICLTLGMSASELWSLLRQVYGNETLRRMQYFEWHERFKNIEIPGRRSVILKTLETGGQTINREFNCVLCRTFSESDRIYGIRRMGFFTEFSSLVIFHQKTAWYHSRTHLIRRI